MNRLFLNEQELRNTGSRLQILCEKIADHVNKRDLPDADFLFLQSQYYRWLGIREFLGALNSNDLEDFMKNTEILADAMIKATEDISA